MIWNSLNRLFFRKKVKIMAYGRTDTGRRRRRNEDSFATITNHNLFIVADGMGGHNAGDVASSNAVNILADYLINHQLHKLAGNQVAIRHMMISGFIHTNDAIMKMASEQQNYKGMGCTMIACFIDNDYVHLCHLGDVRGYRATATAIEQLTSDHSFAAEFQRDFGEETASMKAPPKNIVSRAIGFPLKEYPDYNCTKSRAGTRIIMCSDGLWGMLPDTELMEIVNSSSSPAQACDRFIETANAAGGNDNITAVTIFLQ